MVGRVFRRALETWRNPVFLVPAVIVSVASLLVPRVLNTVLAPFHFGSFAPLIALTDIVLGGVVRLAIAWAGLALLALALALQRGEPATFASRLVPFGVFVRWVFVGAVVGLVGLVGLVLLIVPGIYVGIVWSQVTALMVDGRADFFDALEASQDLTRGSRGAVFVVEAGVVLLLIAPVLVGLAVGLPMHVQDWSWTATVVMALLMTPLAAFNWAVTAALYLDLVASAAPLTKAGYFLAPANSPS